MKEPFRKLIFSTAAALALGAVSIPNESRATLTEGLKPHNFFDSLAVGTTTTIGVIVSNEARKLEPYGNGRFVVVRNQEMNRVTGCFFSDDEPIINSMSERIPEGQFLFSLHSEGNYDVQFMDNRGIMYVGDYDFTNLKRVILQTCKSLRDIADRNARKRSAPVPQGVTTGPH